MLKNIRVEISGGLGNQLFSYFLATHLSSDSGNVVALDFLHADRTIHSNKLSLLDFEIPSNLKILNQKSRGAFYKGIHSRLMSSNSLILESGFIPETALALIREKQKLFICGDMGTFFFFNNVKESERRLQLNNKSSSLLSHLDKVRAKPSLAIHHRLGDFLNIKSSVGLLGPDYYKKSIEAAYDKSNIYVFSNQPSYSKFLFNKWGITSQNIQWIESSEFQGPAENLVAMSSSTSLICSNSTFSYWAAKLGSVSEVFIPEQYRRDGLTNIGEVPSGWIPIHCDWIESDDLL